MKRSSKNLALTVLAGLGFAVLAGRVLGCGASLSGAEPSNELVFDRIWLDKAPRKDTDTFDMFAAITAEPMGIFQRASRWEGAYTLFRYETRGEGKVQLLFPQDGSKHDVKVKAWACNEHGYDYCLEVQGAPRGVKKYFSQKGWEIEGADEAALQRARDRVTRAD